MNNEERDSRRPEAGPGRGTPGADLFWMLLRTEFRQRDQGTAMGFLWTLLHPLLHFLILYALFVHWMGPRVENYAAFLLIGIVQWNFFSAGTTHGLTSLRRKAGLVSNFAFPRLLVPASSVGAVLASHLLEWLLLLLVLPALGVRPAAGWLLLPAVIAAQAALVLALGALLSAAAVEFRDLDHLWGILLYALFFTTPVFYSPEIVEGAGRLLLSLNPMAALIGAARSLLLGAGTSPGPAPWVGAGSAALLAAALLLYPRLSRGAAERL